LAKQEDGIMVLTHDDVVSILGPIDEIVIAEIVATDASREELAQAWAWINSDEALIGEGRHLPAGRVAVLIDLLTPEEDEPGIPANGSSSWDL
jgi:hypothetical protein